ncbi:hypothetical protein M2137_000892 [Parabacteroides sp. PFB2-10]|uniref:hypothetical protein n=1 Tax=Parabacteroides sp. PFB2-10 TaxID=1742405 RepID=UPI002473BE2A|nr:hypothetical protein [Parabacteroides sp. PFB2-10]MDH6312129.1 hypothetical protein [Parabacteroides sp. PFB2-10]MDL2245108.1 hypothetical protein [Parabacteroides sp. OttesenSCG-928-J18]
MKSIKYIYLLFVSISLSLCISCGKDDENEPIPSNDTIDWVQPKVESYEYSMTYIAQVAFPDGISKSTNTVVSAFSGEECRGMVSLKYEAEYDLYICYLTIVSNRLSDEKIVLNVFDGENKKLYNNVQVIDFASNKTLGSAHEILNCK